MDLGRLVLRLWKLHSSRQSGESVASARLDEAWLRFRNLIQDDLQRAERAARQAYDQGSHNLMADELASWGELAAGVLTDIHAEITDLSLLRPDSTSLQFMVNLDSAVLEYRRAARLLASRDTLDGLKQLREADEVWELVVARVEAIARRT